MKYNKILACVLASIALTSNAFAGEAGKTYGGVQYATFKYTEDGIDPEFSPTGLIGRFGKNINDSFSIEGRLGIGLSDDTRNILGIDGTLEIDNLYGVYGVGHVSVSDRSSVYGLICYTRAEATVSAPGFDSSSKSETSISYGRGAKFGFSKSASLNVEYIQYLSKSDFDLNAILVGATFEF